MMPAHVHPGQVIGMPPVSDREAGMLSGKSTAGPGPGGRNPRDVSRTDSLLVYVF